MGRATENQQATPRLSPSIGLRVPAPDLHAAIEEFLLSRLAMGCADSTLKIYADNLARFERAIGSDLASCTPQTAQLYLGDLHGTMKPISVHQHYRNLRTFLSWCRRTGILASDAMAGVMMKPPKTLPRVPDDEAVRRLFHACPLTPEGRRNAALLALLADSGLRIGEALRLRIEDLDFASLTIAVVGGKGGKDGVGFFEILAARMIREWLAIHPEPTPRNYLFVNRHGRRLSRSHGTHILHRLSVRACLPQKWGPHALRHYCATSILRKTGDLELVRQVLRHESLTMTLRYTHLAASDVSAKFRRGSPLNNLQAGRGQAK